MQDDITRVGLPDDTRAVVNLTGHPSSDLKGTWQLLKEDVWKSRIESTRMIKEVRLWFYTRLALFELCTGDLRSNAQSETGGVCERFCCRYISGE